MKRIVTLTLAVLLVSSLLPTRAAAVDNQGPSCTDIKGRDGSYQVQPPPGFLGPEGTAQFHFAFTLAAAPCNFATYYLYVSDSNGDTRTASYPTTLGNDPLTLCDANRFCYEHNFGATPGTAPSTVFVSAASVIRAHTADTAPQVDYVLCDANADDSTYPSPGPVGPGNPVPCPGGDNSWDQ